LRTIDKTFFVDVLLLILEIHVCQDSLFLLDGASGFGHDDFSVCGSSVGFKFSVRFFRLLVASLHSRLNQMALHFTGWDLLMRIVVFAIVQRESVK